MPRFYHELPKELKKIDGFVKTFGHVLSFDKGVRMNQSVFHLSYEHGPTLNVPIEIGIVENLFGYIDHYNLTPFLRDKRIRFVAYDQKGKRYYSNFLKIDMLQAIEVF